VAWASVLYALLAFLPAYVANMSPVLIAKLIPGWKAPIDGGRMGKDGKRILGPGKTWRGLVGGAVTGSITAVVVALLVPPAGASGFFAGWDYGYGGGSPLWAIALFGAIVGFLALVGDAVKSYFKRRTGRDRGRPWVPFDQLDFVVFGLIAMAIASPLLADGWVKHALLDDWVVLATLIVLTPLLHFLVNVIGYVLKLKEVPW
jgi:CDP-2,3-bis-(O-geranylgeranyl)-sn-glycerol synthase